MRSISNPERRARRYRFTFTASITLVILAGIAFATFAARGQAFSGGPLVGTGVNAVVAPAAGETCSSATAISPNALPFTDDSSTVGAANDIDPGPGGCVSGLGPEVVYSFTPSATDTYVAAVTPVLPGFDVSLYVITNCANPAGSCVAGTNARGFAQGESLSVTLNAGTTYFIVIDSPLQGGQGPYHFSLRRGAPENDSCSSPVVIEPSRLPFQAPGTTSGATNDSNPGTPCLRTAQS